MKTNFTTNSGEFSDAALEAALEAEHRKIKELARIKGAHFAKMKLPKLTGDSLSVYVGDIQAKYEEMISRVLQKIQADSSVNEAQIHNALADEKVKALQQKRQYIQTELLNIDLDMKQNGYSLDLLAILQPKKKFYAVLVVIAATEIFFNTSALQLLGDNWLVSLIISIGITAALFGLAHMLAKFLKENKHDKNKRIAAIIGATLLALGVFYLMAVLRSEHLKEQSHYDVNPIFLVFINLLFFVVTVWYLFRNTIPKEDREQYEKLQRIQDKTDSLKEEDVKLEEEIIQIKEETAGKLSVLMNKPGYARYFVQRINNWKRESIEEFKSVNLSLRGDRNAPDCFRENNRDILLSN